MRVRTKICGITRPEYGHAAAAAGADAIGLVFAESPRRVTVEAAAEIVRALPPWVAPVGVFVDEDPGRIREIAAEAGLGAVQLHGDEPAGALAELGPAKVLKAFRVATPSDVRAALGWRDRATALGVRLPDAYLVDARVEGGPKGGTGRAVDWTLAREMIEGGLAPLILSGGLGPENVEEAIGAVRPWGVDASSRLESSPGEKDPERVRAFLAAAMRVRDSAGPS